MGNYAVGQVLRQQRPVRSVTVTVHSLAAWRFREARLLLRRLFREVEPGRKRFRRGSYSVTNPPDVRLPTSPRSSTETGPSTRITLGHSRVTNIRRSTWHHSLLLAKYYVGERDSIYHGAVSRR